MIKIKWRNRKGIVIRVKDDNDDCGREIGEMKNMEGRGW